MEAPSAAAELHDAVDGPEVAVLPVEVEARRCTQCLPAISELMVGLCEAGPFELDRRLLRAIRIEQSLDAAIAPLLVRVTSPEHE